MINIQPAKTAGDFKQISALAHEIWTDHYVPMLGPELIRYMLEKFQSPAAIAQQVEEGVSYYLQYQGDEVAGYLAFYPKDGAMFLSKIYVHKRFRGLGLGRAAMDFVEGHTLAANLSCLRLTVNKKNEGSIGAYERMGFRKTQEAVFDIGQGFFMDDYVLEKEL